MSNGEAAPILRTCAPSSKACPSAAAQYYLAADMQARSDDCSWREQSPSPKPRTTETSPNPPVAHPGQYPATLPQPNPAP